MIINNIFDEPIIKAEIAAKDVHKKEHNKDLYKYNANLWIRDRINKLDIEVISYHFRSQTILGHSMIDELGSSIMINDAITDSNRRNFTLAHELGHHVMHRNILRHSSMYDLKDDLTNTPKSSPLEIQANVFAANLLLPFKVFEMQLVTGCSAYEIKHLSGISIEMIKYRAKDFLIHYFYLDETHAEAVANDFVESYNRDSDFNTVLKDLIDNTYPVTYLLPGSTPTQTREKNSRILPIILKKWDVEDMIIAQQDKPKLHV